MIRMLVSVQDVPDALAAASAGADFSALKDPAAGALGGLALQRIVTIVAALRAAHPCVPISATIGDIESHRIAEVPNRVDAVAACGVDYVKVGIEPGLESHALLAALARSDVSVVPVLLCDASVDLAQLDAALALAAFPALMLDTTDKRSGSLLTRVSMKLLGEVVTRLRSRHMLAGLAGALRLTDLPALRELSPDFAGFRSALCDGPRSSALDVARVRAVRQALHDSPVLLE